MEAETKFGSSPEPKLEHLSALHCECIARAKVLLTTDLESFAHHAKRSMINQDDVLLFTRRNPQLRKFLDEKLTVFDGAVDGEDESIVMQSAKRRMRQSVKDAKKSLEKSSSMSLLKTYFPSTETVTTSSAVTAPSTTSVKDPSIPVENVPAIPNILRVKTSPLKRALLKSALSPAKTPSSSKAAETMEVSSQKTPETKDSPVPTVSTPIKDGRQQSGVGPLGISLLDSDDEFSNIFNDSGDV
ncbi:hypothetical protein TcWFU_007923 [Taenia crassiceps]|uniref:Centromere protein S n=1 Tax=Taenia crassiceps TaxID=6207 RepID=A0ABR4QEF3_9CEST